MGDTVIIRQQRTRNFTILDNAQVRDARLSWKARGLLAYLLSLSEGWQLRISYLTRQAPDGRHSTRAGLAELQRHGYLVIARERGVHGRFERTTWTIVQTPPAVANEKPAPTAEAANPTACATVRPPRPENQTVVAAHHDPENQIVEKWIGTTEEPSSRRTTTTSRLPLTVKLVMPSALKAEEVVVVQEFVSSLPEPLAQQVLDELAGAMGRQGAIKASPVAFLRALAKRAANGEFHPSLGIPVAAARRRNASEEVARATERANRERRREAATSDGARRAMQACLAEVGASLGIKR